MQNHFRRIFLLATFVCFTATMEVRAEVTLEQLRQMAIEWRQSFKSLRVTGEWKSLPDSQSLLMDLPTLAERDAAPVWMKLDWIWSEQGLERLELIRYSPKADIPSVDNVIPWQKDLDVYNGPGKFFFSAQYRILEESNEVLDQLRIVGVFDGVPPAQNLTELIPGIFEPYSRLWLSDQLSPYHPTNIPVRPPGASTEYSTQRYWKYSGTEMLLGSLCAKLVHADQPTDPDSHSPATRTLWLDIEHNGLPRRILTEYVREDESTTGIDFVVDEFQQLESGIWFPRVARRRLPSGETSLCLYTSVGLNVALNEHEFQPPQPHAQTRVTDTLGLANAKVTHDTANRDTTNVAESGGQRTNNGSYAESPVDQMESGSTASNAVGGQTTGIVVGLICGLLLIGYLLRERRSGRR